MKYIPELTGLRGLAALMVFVGHASKDGLLPEFLNVSYATQGVLLFFMLSGFLIGHLYLEKKINKKTLTEYVSARIGRVFPLYFIILILSLFISFFVYPEFHYNFKGPLKLLLAFLFINTPYELWTIPIEVQFYICFILFWFFYSKEKKNTLILVSIPFLVFIPSILYFIFKHKIPHIMPTFSLFFFAGVFLSVLKNKGLLEGLTKKVPLFISWLVLFLFIINLVGLRKIFGLTETHPVHNVYSIILLLCFMIMITSKPSDFTVLRSKLMLFIGEISFGFYLIHRPIMKIIISYNFNPLIKLLIVFSTTTIVAYLLYRIIERPARKTITNFFLKTTDSAK